jgi:hypothetical protein
MAKTKQLSRFEHIKTADLLESQQSAVWVCGTVRLARDSHEGSINHFQAEIEHV